MVAVAIGIDMVGFALVDAVVVLAVMAVIVVAMMLMTLRVTVAVWEQY